MRAGLGRALGASSAGASAAGKLRRGVMRIKRVRVTGPVVPAIAYSFPGAILIQKKLRSTR
jgi:hypothetical protein